MNSQTRLLALYHLVANVFILWLGYYWLGLSESRSTTLTWSALIALVVIVLTSCTYSAALVFFSREGTGQALAAWKTAARNLVPLTVAAIGIGIVYWLLSRVTFQDIAFRIASWLTMTLRKPVKPATVLRIFTVGLWLVRWMLVPVLLLPMVSAIATQGWSGFRAIGRRMGGWLTWIGVPVLLSCAFAFPLLLIQWVPEVDGFALQSASFVVRAAVAYLLFGISWLMLAFITSRGKPDFTQPRTVVSP